MPNIAVAKQFFRDPVVHFIRDDGWSLCGRPEKNFVGQVERGQVPSPCPVCFEEAVTTPDIDHEWFIEEISQL